MMLKKLFILFCFLNLLSACALLQEENQPLNIGLMNGFGSGNKVITETGTTFDYKPNGVCDLNQQAVPCMWWGFELQHSPQQEFSTLSCLSKKTLTPEPANQKSLFTPTSLQYRWQALLPPKATRHSIAMHTTNENNLTGIVTIHTTCESEHIKSFEFSMTIFFNTHSKNKANIKAK